MVVQRLGSAAVADAFDRPPTPLLLPLFPTTANAAACCHYYSAAAAAAAAAVAGVGVTEGGSLPVGGRVPAESDLLERKVNFLRCSVCACELVDCEML